MRLPILFLVLVLAGASVAAAPVVFWASDPVGPGETVLATGDGLGEGITVEVTRLADGVPTAPSEKPTAWTGQGRRASVLQLDSTSIKFVVPQEFTPGVFAYRVVGPDGAALGLLNAPDLWWSQGEAGTAANAGGSLWLFGKNLTSPGVAATVILRGPRTLRLKPQGDAFAVKVTLPRDLPPGEYQAFLHSGRGGDAAWSRPVVVRVEKPASWPAKVYNVRDFGAQGTGSGDDTAALQAALDKAGAEGGGVVFLPRGRYQMSGPLNIPRFTVVRGEGRELTSVFWPDMAFPPAVLIQAGNSFGMEDLTFYCSNYKAFLVADNKSEDAGNVFLRRLRIRADAYRGHLKAEEVDTRWRQGLGGFGGGRFLITLGGRNVTITDSDFYSSSCVFSISRAKGARIQGNTFHMGRWGSNGIFGGEGVVVCDNRFLGADLMSWGNGIGFGHLSHLYWARNVHQRHHGGDREAVTSDGSGGLYYGALAAADAGSITLPEPPKNPAPRWVGAAVYVVSGKGEGQWRRAIAYEGARVVLDRPWQVTPDTTSRVAIISLLHQWLVVNNRFEDVGIAVQFYGASIEHIVAGNTCARAGGYQSIGKAYGGYHLPPEKNPGHQPSWYCQFLNNTITEGNIYRSGANNAILSDESVIGIYGWPLRADWPWPYNRGAVVRGNHLASSARIHVGGRDSQPATVRDVLIENNRIAASGEAIRVDGSTAGVLVRGNRFDTVSDPLTGQGATRAWVAPGQKADIALARARTLARVAAIADDPLGWPGMKAALSLLRALSPTADSTPTEAEITRLTLAGVAARKPDLPLAAVEPLLGLRLSLAPKATLPQVLRTGAGGAGTLALNLMARSELPAWPVAARVLAPEGWQAGEVSGTLGAAKPLEIACQVPAGVWGRVELPVQVTLTVPGGGAVRLHSRVAAGSGYLREWMVMGPFANKSGAPLDFAIHAPEDRLDLKAEAEGVTGKVRWQEVRRPDDWLDLNTLFSRKEPGVAYALACLNAERDTDAVLCLGFSGGVALFVNGDYVWSASASRKAAPNQERVKVSLRAGDNVLLFKISTATPEWRFTAEVTPPAGGFAGKLLPVPPSQFAGRAAFTPPPMPAPTAGEIRHASGVNWRLVYADDFERPTLGTRWRVASGKVQCAGGLLSATGDRAFIAYAEKLPAPVRIEYDTRVPADRASDLSAFWLAQPENHGSGTLIGFGSNSNTMNKVLIEGEQTTTSTTPLITPGKWHHVIAQILADGRVQLIVDGQTALNAPGKATGAARHPGLWTWGGDALFDNVRIYTGR